MINTKTNKGKSLKTYSRATLRKTPFQKEFRQQNRKRGREAELEWLDLLRGKYPEVTDNNEIDRFALKDATCIHEDGSTSDHELKSRNCNHNSFVGLMVGNDKYKHSIERLNDGIPTYYYFKCNDGLFYFKFDNFEKQKHCFIFGGINGNIRGGELAKPVVDIKAEYLLPFVKE
jgi:hypothetical protein